MFTWLEAAVICEELYGAEVNMKEGYFVCPECGEPIYESDWMNWWSWKYCPVCDFNFFEEDE